MWVLLDVPLVLLSDNSANVVTLVGFFGLAGKRLEVLQVAPGVFLVLTDVIHHVGNDHGEPTEHGHQHGVVCGPFGQVAQVRVHGHEGPSLLVQELRTPAQDPGGGLVIVRHAADGLLEGAVAVPGVVVHDDAGLQASKGVLVNAGDAVMREVQHLQSSLHATERSLTQSLHRVVRQVELPQEPKSVKDLVGHGADLVVVQPEQHGVGRQAGRDLLEARLAAGDVEAVEVRVALAQAAFGTHASRGEAQRHEDKALEKQAHGDGARQPHVQQSHTGRPSAAAFRPGPQRHHQLLHLHRILRRLALALASARDTMCEGTIPCCLQF